MLNAKVFFCSFQRESTSKSLKNNFHDFSTDPEMKSLKISRAFGLGYKLILLPVLFG